MSGVIDERVYATYLYNQAQCYAELENLHKKTLCLDIRLV